MIPRIVLLLTLCLSGCGYRTSQGGSAKPAGYQWRSLHRDDVATVAVPIFTNRSFRRGVEFALSKAIVNQLEATTPYKVVSREHADTLLEGEILDTHIRTLSPDVHTGVPQEQLYIVRVNFTWKDLRTGKILVDRRRFEQSTTFYPTLGEGQFLGSEQNVERLALAIVQELQADW
jgi:Lipopolysaccharide-assembly